MSNDCPAPQVWSKVLEDDVTIGQRAVLEAHLVDCQACVEVLIRLAGDWSLAADPSARQAPPLGPDTIAMLARVAATPL